ncbi:MAG: aminotransferase class I/II-fold pyridoxal phosphate-dependent enzyme, partial [Leptospiraceae bacterium]|nr:aminotransferase class I/II-fold pyridoxal phosphate-dependent enzyme [Leptospiraceae bacterium]
EFKTIENFTPPEAGIVCFPKLKKNISSSEYSDNLMKDCKIFVLPGSDFECEGYIRVGLGEESTIFEKGIQKWLEWEKN